MILLLHCQVQHKSDCFFMKFVQHKLLRGTKANLLNVSWLPNLIPTSSPQKIPSCQRIVTQLSTDVALHAGKEKPNLGKKKKSIQIHISLNLRGSRRERNKLFQIISIKLLWVLSCSPHRLQGIACMWSFSSSSSSRVSSHLGQSWDIISSSTQTLRAYY